MNCAAKRAAESARQSGHAFTERGQTRAGLAFFGLVLWRARLDGAAGCAAVSFRPLMDRRKGAAQTDPFGVAGIDAGDERRDKIIEERCAELAADKGSHGFIF